MRIEHVRIRLDLDLSMTAVWQVRGGDEREAITMYACAASSFGAIQARQGDSSFHPT